MSHPPEYPGRQRLKRAVAQAGSDAYQGAFEAVGSVLVACGIGFWVDRQWETAPYGVLIGAVVGFAAMVLRLMRLGKSLHPDPDSDAAVTGKSPGTTTDGIDDDRAIGESLGISDALRDDSTKVNQATESDWPSGKNEENEEQK